MAINIYSDPQKYNKKLAKALQGLEEFKAPEWSLFVKTGSSKERPPFDYDFWYRRAASILRQMYRSGLIGVEKLRTRYGSRKNRGMAPDKFKKSGGKIIRVILQQAEKAGFVEKATDGKLKGRKLTAKGRAFLEGIKFE
jgi:small subunit ribosomal protein S19e